MSSLYAYFSFLYEELPQQLYSKDYGFKREVAIMGILTLLVRQKSLWVSESHCTQQNSSVTRSFVSCSVFCITCYIKNQHSQQPEYRMSNKSLSQLDCFREKFRVHITCIALNALIHSFLNCLRFILQEVKTSSKCFE